MAKRTTSSACQLSLSSLLPTITVIMTVSSEHPLLKLKRQLNWVAIKEVMLRHLRQANRNVDGGPGRPLDVDLYVPVIVLMLLKHLNAREMETLLMENAPARAFIGWEDTGLMQVRDHSNIARILESLGDSGVTELNAVIIKEAVAMGLADASVLSGDTTAQELPIGYPHEAGIMKGLAERCARALVTLGKKGKTGLAGMVEACKGILKSAKEYHLFAKGKEQKDAIVRKMVDATEQLLSKVQVVVKQGADTAGRNVKRAYEQLSKMVGVGKRLLPQILHWLNTGKVASGKIIHAGLTLARAIVRNKAGKAVEFGLQYLLCRIRGGYVFGELIEKATGESKMPGRCLSMYRKLFGKDKTPDMMVFDRGGYSEANIKKLSKEGVAKVGIQPKGRAAWAVNETDRAEVMSERAKMEGVIGTLKSDRHGFNKPRERKDTSVRMAGQRSIISRNLTKLMADLMKQGNVVKAVGQGARG